MAKTYIFDTNVLIDDCNSIYRFEDSLIIIPMIVLEELDHLKKKDGKIGESARRANRELEKIRKIAIEQETSLAKGVYVESCNTRIKVWAEGSEILPSMSKESNDNKIIMVAYEFSKRYKKKYPNREVVLISNDINVRVKADSINVKCEKYNTDEITDVLYGGVAKDVQLPKSKIDTLFKTGFIEIEDLFCQFGYEDALESMHINQYGCIKSVELNGGSALVKYTKKNSGEWIASLIDKNTAFDIKGRNREQRYALDALMDPSVQLVTLVGIPGSGKTLLAMAAALEQSNFSLFSGNSKKSVGRRAKGGRKKRVLNYQDEDFFMEDIDYTSQKYGIAEGVYEKIVFTKPVVSVGKEVGFMPGGIIEKMDPWLQPIWDNLNVLFRSPDMVEQFKLNDCVEISAMSHIRGRSIANSFIVIDEAQNMDKHEIKTVLTRVAEGSKIVLTGDVGQIDSKNLDKFSNGLSIVLEKFKDKPYASHITLKEGQRLQLASDASYLLD